MKFTKGGSYRKDLKAWIFSLTHKKKMMLKGGGND